MNKRIVEIAKSTKLEGEEIRGCFRCPLKWSCAIWLWKENIERFNHGNCSCTDERLVATAQPFYVDLELLKKLVDR